MSTKPLSRAKREEKKCVFKWKVGEKLNLSQFFFCIKTLQTKISFIKMLTARKENAWKKNVCRAELKCFSTKEKCEWKQRRLDIAYDVTWPSATFSVNDWRVEVGWNCRQSISCCSLNGAIAGLYSISINAFNCKVEKTEKDFRVNMTKALYAGFVSSMNLINFEWCQEMFVIWNVHRKVRCC